MALITMHPRPARAARAYCRFRRRRAIRPHDMIAALLQHLVAARPKAAAHKGGNCCLVGLGLKRPELWRIKRRMPGSSDRAIFPS